MIVFFTTKSKKVYVNKTSVYLIKELFILDVGKPQSGINAGWQKSFNEKGWSIVGRKTNL